MSEQPKAAALPDEFIVGAWRVLRTQNRLAHLHEAGTVEPLEPKAMDVLCVLAARGRRPPRVKSCWRRSGPEEWWSKGRSPA